MLKGLLFALLAIDTAWFVWSGATSKAIDAAAWLTLLALFQIETRPGTPPRTRTLHLTLHALRIVAAAGVIAATVRYVFEDNVLDTVNSTLWIGVVVLLETQLRLPALAARMSRPFTGVAVLLYGGLAVLVPVWASRGEWFDAYDALLWLIAFAWIEVEVAGTDARQRGGTPA